MGAPRVELTVKPHSVEQSVVSYMVHHEQLGRLVRAVLGQAVHMSSSRSLIRRQLNIVS